MDENIMAQTLLDFTDFVKLKEFIETNPFIYGTAGRKQDIPRPEIGNFLLGVRSVNQAKYNYQTMDMYYGDGGKINTFANRTVLEFLVLALVNHIPEIRQNHKLIRSLANSVNPTKSFGYGIAGSFSLWEENPRIRDHFGQTLTKELSEMIRWLICTLGGTLIFEGAEVYYKDIFDSTKKGSAEGVKDTVAEAKDLFQFFTRTSGSRASFGCGQLIFYWYGKEVVPSKLLFLTSWDYNKFAHMSSNLQHPSTMNPTMNRVDGTLNDSDLLIYIEQNFRAANKERNLDSTLWLKFVALNDFSVKWFKSVQARKALLVAINLIDRAD